MLTTGVRARAHTARLGAVVVAVTLVSVAAPLTARAADPRVVVARGLAVGAGATRVPLPATTSVDIGLVAHDHAGLMSLVGNVANPSSPQFRHFLSKGAFANRFGVRASTVDSLRRYFSKFGLSVHSQMSSNLLLRISGPTSGISRAFRVALTGIRRSGGLAVTQFVGAATLPASIAHAITGVAGLSSWRPRTSHLQVTPRLAPRVSSPGSCSAANSVASVGGFTANQQAVGYGLDQQWLAGHDGTGQTVGVYELNKFSSSDLSTYFHCYGVSPTVTTVDVDGGPGNGTSGLEEADLDIQEVGALAPGANIIVYQGPNNNTGPIDVFAKIASDDLASVVTSSWGGCESIEVGASDIATESTIFDQMTVQGQSVFAASGDNGSSDCQNSSSLTVDDPASQPNVTGVGGLTIFQLGSVSPPVTVSAQVWNDGSGSGGGGISAIWSRPSWQRGSSVPSGANRLVPDLSVMADPHTGFIDYVHGFGWSTVGGTSIGAPIMAAIGAYANEACGTRLGLINPSIYRMAALGTGFDDIVTGNNSLTAPVNPSKYGAGIGYDLASGLGSPDPATFINDLCSQHPSSSTSTVTTSPSSSVDLAAGATITLTVNNALGTPLASINPTVTATETGARVTVTPQSSVTDINGQLVYALTTNKPGVVSVSFTDGSAAIATDHVTVGSTVSVAASTLHALGVPLNTISVDTTATSTVAVGLSSTGHVLETSGASGPVTDLTTKLHLMHGIGNPSLGCSAVNCIVVEEVMSHLMVITNAATPASAAVSDLGKLNAQAAAYKGGTASVIDARPSGYYAVGFLTTSGAVGFAQWRQSTHAVTFVNVTTKFHLPAASLATSLVSDSLSQSYLAVHVGSSYRLVAIGTSNSATNVAQTAHYTSSGSNALTSAPVLERDGGAAHALQLLARTSSGRLLLFGGAALTPNSLSKVVVLTNSGATASRFLPGVGNGDCVLYITAGTPQVAMRNPSWSSTTLANASSVSLHFATLTSGRGALVNSGSIQYVITM